MLVSGIPKYGLQFCTFKIIGDIDKSVPSQIISVHRIRIRWIRNILASWIRIRKNMRIQGVEYKPKTANAKTFLLDRTPQF